MRRAKPRLELVAGARRPRNAPVERGYAPSYRAGEINHCPGCDRSNWIVGRVLAECAFCGTAMPLSGVALAD